MKKQTRNRSAAPPAAGQLVLPGFEPATDSPPATGEAGGAERRRAEAGAGGREGAGSSAARKLSRPGGRRGALAMEGSLLHPEKCRDAGDPVKRSQNRKVRYRRRREAARRAMVEARRRAGVGEDERLPDGVKPSGVFFCGHASADSDVTVRGGSGLASFFSGVEHCGLVWQCPDCSASIRSARSEEIQEAVRVWQSRGNGVMLVTVTVRHSRGDELGTMLDGMSAAWRYVVSGAAWAGKPERVTKSGRVVPAVPGVRQRLRIAGYVRTLEITYGENGWHPHYHFLFFVEEVPTAELGELARAVILDRWLKGLENVNRKSGDGAGKISPPSERHGVDVQVFGANADGAAKYVAKVMEETGVEHLPVAMEMARADLKEVTKAAGSLTPFQLLDVQTAQAERLWAGYVDATYGKRSIYMTRGLRERLGMGEEVDDVELASAEPFEAHDLAVIEREPYEAAARTAPERLADVLRLIDARKWADAARLLGCGVAVDATQVWYDTGGELDDCFLPMWRPRFTRAVPAGKIELGACPSTELLGVPRKKERAAA